MKTRLITILIASMFAASGQIFAQETFKAKGDVAISGVSSSVNAKDAAKFNEFRDLSDGVSGSFNFIGSSNRYFLNAFGENLGRDDMHLVLSGGKYGLFKFQVYGDWLKHNFGFGPDGAQTPYLNPGSTTLTLFSNVPATLANTSSWSSFDFRSERRNVGGSFEFSPKSSWYTLIEANQINQTGINKVDAAALGTSPGNGFIDLPYPVDYMTRNASVEGGYQTERGHLSVNVTTSRFRNKNMILNFQNPFFGFGTDTATFSPDNDYVRVSTNGMLRHLFMNSTFSGRLTYDRGSDDIGMVDRVLNTGGSAALTATLPTAPKFYGKVENATAGFSLTSEPLRKLNSRIYYNYYKRQNHSTEITFAVPLSTAGLVCSEPGTTIVALTVDCENEHYSYTKQNTGLETEYRLPYANRVSAGFDFLDTTRNRFDTEKTREYKYFAKVSNSSLDALSGSIKYQFMRRRSEFTINDIGVNANDPFFLERFNRSFDVANLDQHQIKASVDLAAMKLLDFGFEAYYKRNSYKDLTLGRTKDSRKEFYASVTYGNPEKFQVTLFGDIEFIDYYAYHRTISVGACTIAVPNCFDPTTPANASAFNWGSHVEDKNWTVEFAADWPVTPKLLFKASAVVQETKGTADFQAQTLSNGTPAALLFPINAYDNIRRKSVNPQAVYQIARQAELTIGYSYENYNFNDAPFNSYQYVIGPGTTSASYLSGIYAFPGYHAHIAYAGMRYKF